MDIQKRRFVYLHSSGISQKKLGEIFTNEDIDDFYENISIEKLGKYFPTTQAEKILENIKTLDTTKIDTLCKDIEILTTKDAAYPKSLLHLSSVPTLLYVKGKLENQPSLGVVGSRKMTDYGKRVLDVFIPHLTRYFCIISGGAYGCDSYAHQKTLECHGKTIVILGTGIDIIHPTQNKKMYEQVVSSGGALVSIFPIGTQGTSYTFPMRNEIISGMSQGILVVEAAEKSGSLITAKLALEQGKDVFSIPGDVFKTNSIGCLSLIQKAEAKLVYTPQDILDEYNISGMYSTETKKIELSDDIEKQIIHICTTQGQNINQIAKEIGKNISEIGVKISILELKGYIKKDSSGKYQVV